MFFHSTDDYERNKREADLNLANAFVKHLKQLITNRGDSQSDSIQIATKTLYLNFKVPVKIGYSQYEKRQIKEAHYIAQKEGLISIDETLRPFKYSILKLDNEKFKLRPYQTNIIETVKEKEGSVLIEAPTGSGKSVIASHIAKNETEKGGKVLIVAPKIILLEQLQETFASLKPQIIHGAKDYDKGHSVFISTIQTAHNRDLGFEPTMILIDEVHFGFSGKMIKNLLADFKGRLIGLSATPYDKDGFVLKGFDYHLDKYDLRYMLENNYLVYPKCYSPLKVDLSKISVIGGDYNQGELESEFNNIESVIQIVETTKEKILERKAALIFCISIAHSEAMAKAFTDNGVPTKAIHSKLSKDEQNTIMQEYKSGKLKMLANPMILTTGFDYPATDCIVLARATQSQNLYRQMVGRGLRISEGKEDALVLDCAGVIADLGLPTTKISINLSSNTKSKSVCGNCGSERLYRKVSKNKVVMMCADCGDYEIAQQKGYECTYCGLVHSSQSSFVTRDNQLFLVCDSCSGETLISTSTSKEELSLIIDTTRVELLQKQVTLDYLEQLMESESPSFIFNDEVIEHLQAIQHLVAGETTLFFSHSKDKLANHCIAYRDDSDENQHFTTHQYSDKYIWKHCQRGYSWRLFSKEIEDELLNEGLSTLKESLLASQRYEDTINLTNRILELTDKEPLEKVVTNKLLSEMQGSKLANIEEMCNKRIKDLLFNNEDLYKMSGFVKIMESVLK